MSSPHRGIEFTGEFLVPGATENRIVRDHEARYSWAGRFVAGKSALDIACGAGYGTRSLVESGASSAVGVDINAEALRFASANYANERVAFVDADICMYDGEGRRFDLITCFETTEHVDDHMGAVANLHRLLAPGGCLLISSPNRPVTSPGATSLADRPANPHHVREFVPEELRAVLVSAGFEVEDTLFGQRIERILPGRLMTAMYGRIVRPQATKDPTVQPVLGGRPRYFALVAHAR